MKRKPELHNQDQSPPYGIIIAKKLPEVTALFWIVKLLTTGMGETTSDYLAHQMKPDFCGGPWRKWTGRCLADTVLSK